MKITTGNYFHCSKCALCYTLSCYNSPVFVNKRIHCLPEFTFSLNVIQIIHRLWNVTCMTYDEWPLLWRHNELDGVSIDRRLDCLFNRCAGADQRKHQSSASLPFVRGIHRWALKSRPKGPVTRKLFPFDDVIMLCKIELKMEASQVNHFNFPNEEGGHHVNPIHSGFLTNYKRHTDGKIWLVSRNYK